MDEDLALISDGDGLAVIGDPTAVERFIVSEGLSSRGLAPLGLGPAFSAAAGTAQAGSEIAANSGRWVKLTEESAQNLKKYGLTETKTPGVSHAMLGKRGSIKKWLQIEKGPGSVVTNPAMLAGVAGIMAQVAMQQSMDEITDYLATIDEKVDDVLRAQKDAVLADMIGVELVIEEAMTVREHVGRVSEVTWSKVQATSATIARTQAYALRQLDALADKVERKTRVGDVAKTAKESESKSQEWLAVLARCFQLQDAIAVLELDRVLEASPGELDRHRVGLKAARRERLELIARSTERLMARLDAAAGTANTRVLFHPTTSPAVVQSSNHVALAVTDLRGRLGIEPDRQPVDARRWADAATDAKDKAVEKGADGVDAAKRLGARVLDRSRSATEEFSSRIAHRTFRGHGDGEEGRDEG